jgi:hypothetical protein
MSLRLEQIENQFGESRAGNRKWMKNQRNRKIRRVKTETIPNIKYCGWEY